MPQRKRRKRLHIANKRQARPRDSQRSKFYKASQSYTLSGHFFRSIDEVQAYVDSITNELKIPQIKVVKSASKHISRAYLEKRVIRLSVDRFNGKRGFTEFIVLHEMAHIFTNREYAAHSPEYVRIFLWLIENFIHFINAQPEDSKPFTNEIEENWLKAGIKISSLPAMQLMELENSEQVA